MNRWLYTLRERMTPAMPDRWSGYGKFSGFVHISELVTLDSIMCADLITTFQDEDWQHNVHEDFRTELFRDADYLLSRMPLDPTMHQLLAVFEHPDGSETIPSNFVGCGYDIMDSYFGNSTLTNCGPIPEAFAPYDVNDFGLVPDCRHAFDIRDRMRALQPNDAHLGACEVWFVARYIPNGEPSVEGNASRGNASRGSGLVSGVQLIPPWRDQR